jgi:Skp family chaperone for outer membrane proteins
MGATKAWHPQNLDKVMARRQKGKSDEQLREEILQLLEQSAQTKMPLNERELARRCGQINVHECEGRTKFRIYDRFKRVLRQLLDNEEVEVEESPLYEKPVFKIPGTEVVRKPTFAGRREPECKVTIDPSVIDRQSAPAIEPEQAEPKKKEIRLSPAAAAALANRHAATTKVVIETEEPMKHRSQPRSQAEMYADINSTWNDLICEGVPFTRTQLLRQSGCSTGTQGPVIDEIDVALREIASHKKWRDPDKLTPYLDLPKRQYDLFAASIHGNPATTDRLAEMERKLAELEAENERLRTEAQKPKAVTVEVDQLLGAQLSTLDAAIADMQRELSALESKLDAARSKRSAIATALDALRESDTHRRIDLEEQYAVEDGDWVKRLNSSVVEPFEGLALSGSGNGASAS